MKHTCQYCKKDFIKESSLAVHSCEPRRRRQERDEAGVRLGFHAYIKFYELTQGSAELQHYYLQSSNHYVNKHFFAINRHPKLQWLCATAVSPG